MKKILLSLCLGVIAAAGFTASAVTIDDLCGKVVGQVYWGNELHSMRNKTYVPAYISTGVFERVPGSATQLRLNHFKNAQDVLFEFKNNTLTLLNVASGARYSDSNDGGTVTLRMQAEFNLNNSNTGYKTYYGFINNTSSSFYGTPETLADGTIHINLNGNSQYIRALQFQKTSSHGGNMATLNDFCHTYMKVDLYIYDGNGTMSYDVEGTPATDNVLVTRKDATDKTTFTIRNFGGYGWMYEYIDEDQNNYVINPDGVTAIVDNATNTVTVPVQSIYGVISPHGVYYGKVSSSAGYVPMFRSDYTITASIELSNWSSQAITGSYEVLAGEHTTWHPWDKNCGGKLETTKKAMISLDDWVMHYANNNGEQEIDAQGDGTEIVFELPATHTGELVIDAFKVNHDAANPDDSQKNNVYVKCHLENKVNNRLVENYELCMVPGNFKNINEDHGHNIHNDYGFEKVVNLSKDGYEHHIGTSRAATLNSSEDGSFELAVPASVIKANGWDFDNKENNKFTFFVKANYKEGSAKDGSRLAPTFHALNYTADQITTGIEAASFDADIRIVAVNGGIEVEGAENVEVYNVGGSQVYQGAAGHIDVAAGLYIVRADGKVAKVNVK